MTDDAELLRRYARERSDYSFSQLVLRHVDFVYSAALRQTDGDHHKAQEVTQMVFIGLARKASRLVHHPVLPAWLHRSSYLAALELRRKEARRRAYERAAGAEAAITGTEAGAILWEAVRPVLDEAINELDEADRQAVLLRFFGDRPFAEVGVRLRLSENAARMRVERAVEKLHGRLESRGITSSAAALALVLTGHAIVAAPSGVAVSSAAAAVAAATGSSGILIAVMSTSKLPVALTAALLVGGTASVALKDNSERPRRAELAELTRQDAAIATLSARNAGLVAESSQTKSLRDFASGIGALSSQVAALEARAAEAKAMPARTTPGDAAKSVFDLSKLDVVPRVATQGRPVDPPDLAGMGGSGQVLVDFIVGSDGLVYNAYAVSSTNRTLEDSAVQAVNGWTFRPGQVAGQNVCSHMQVPIVFTLSDSPAPSGPETWF